MNKEQFNALDKIDQINYINSQLLEGQTLTAVCKSIGIGRTTIRDRFEKAGYKYNAEIKQYQSYVEVVDLESSNSVVEADKFNEEVFVQASSNPVVGSQSNYSYDDLVKVIENYAELNNKMDEVYSWYQLQNSSNGVVVEEDKFAIKDFKGDTVTRSFKMYESVQKKFMKFCKKHSQYRVQDILSTLLDEAIEKYK